MTKFYVFETDESTKYVVQELSNHCDIWDKIFKNGPSEMCGRQPLKNLK